MESDEEDGKIFEIPEVPSPPVDIAEDDSFFEDFPSEKQEPAADVVIEPPRVQKSPRVEIVEEPIPVETVSETRGSAGTNEGDIHQKSFFEALKLKITTRNVKNTIEVEKEPEQESDPVKQRSYIERKFSPMVGETPKENGNYGNKKSNVIPEISLWGRVKNIRYVYKILSLWPLSAIFGSSEEQIRTSETGLTPRQRIKRYNTIHEGGYGMPKEKKEEPIDDKAAETQQVAADGNR
jgi:hypothetical protein